MPDVIQLRLSQLDEFLRMDEYSAQWINIRTAITLYQNPGSAKGRVTYIQGGAVVPIDGVQEGSPYWIEAIGGQYPNMAPGESFSNNPPVNMMHQIPVNIGLPSSWGYMTVLMGNDTGSDFINVSQHEVYSLGYNPQIHFATPVLVSAANGLVIRSAIRLLVQILDRSGVPITEWFYENGTIVPSLGCPRLSGSEMRSQVYFATAPRDPQQPSCGTNQKPSHQSSPRHSIVNDGWDLAGLWARDSAAGMS